MAGVTVLVMQPEGAGLHHQHAQARPGGLRVSRHLPALWARLWPVLAGLAPALAIGAKVLVIAAG